MPGSVGSLARKRGERVAFHGARADQQEQDPQFYQRVDSRRFADERWMDELTDAQLRLFAIIAGRENARHGYPPSLERRTVDTTSAV